MPPTIQTSNPGTPSDKRVPSTPVPTRPTERKSEIVCRVKYNNTLPDIPFDCKFIAYPFESTRFIEYKSTSLERSYKYEVLTEHDLGVTIDLINKDTYAPNYNLNIDPADEKLLEEDMLTPQDSKRSRHHARSVSWLRRTEYISTEQTRFQPQVMDKVEAKVGFSIKKNFKDDTLYMDRESQIKAIEKTFEDSKLPIEKHYSKPNVTPVEVMPVYPDFKYWKYPCAQVIFDTDPAPVGRSVPAQIEEMSQAMIRGVMDESGEQFVAYFLPTSETLDKRKLDQLNNVEYTDEMEYEYKMAREYNWNVKSKTSKGYEENYFLIIRDDAVYYNELETRVRLNKRRQKIGAAPNNTRLVVTHRPLNATEFRIQRLRERFLEPPNEEEEEEEDDEEEEEEETEEQEAEGGDNGNKEKTSDNEDKNSSKHSSRASSRSHSKSKSPSPSKRSHSGSSRGTNRSHSGSPQNKSRSKSPENRSKSGSPARSKSRSPVRSKSRSQSKSKSRSPADSNRSRSVSPAGSKTSKSAASSRSTSPAGNNRSRSGSRSDKSRSKSRSKSKSPASSAGSRSSSRSSRSGSPAESNRSKSASPARSDKSGGSASSNRSRSKSRAKSTSRSRSNSPAGSNRSISPATSARSRSGSPAGSNRSASGSPRSRSVSRAPSDRSRSKSRAPSNSGSEKSAESGSGSSSGSDSGSDSD